jgi:hypothetical protein
MEKGGVGIPKTKQKAILKIILYYIGNNIK